MKRLRLQGVAWNIREEFVLTTHRTKGVVTFFAAGGEQFAERATNLSIIFRDAEGLRVALLEAIWDLRFPAKARTENRRSHKSKK